MSFVSISPHSTRRGAAWKLFARHECVVLHAMRSRLLAERSRRFEVRAMRQRVRFAAVALVGVVMCRAAEQVDVWSAVRDRLPVVRPRTVCERNRTERLLQLPRWQVEQRQRRQQLHRVRHRIHFRQRRRCLPGSLRRSSQFNMHTLCRASSALLWRHLRQHNWSDGVPALWSWTVSVPTRRVQLRRLLAWRLHISQVTKCFLALRLTDDVMQWFLNVLRVPRCAVLEPLRRNWLPCGLSRLSRFLLSLLCSVPNREVQRFCWQHVVQSLPSRQLQR